MTVVYLDSVFLFNALLDYLLFLSTARLAGIPLRRRRYLLSGVLGGLYAAAVFLPGGGFLTETLVKAGVGLLLALIAFGRETHFLRLTLLTVAIACALAGTVGGAAHSQRPGNFLYECQRENPAAFCVRGLPAADGDLSGGGRPRYPGGVSAGDGVPAGANGGPHRIAGHGQQPAGHRRGTGADGGAVPVSAACGGHSAPSAGRDPAYAAPALSKAASPAFADADGGGRRAAGQREQRLDGDRRRLLSKFADRPDGYRVGGRIYRFMGRGREKGS